MSVNVQHRKLYEVAFHVHIFSLKVHGAVGGEGASDLLRHVQISNDGGAAA